MANYDYAAVRDIAEVRFRTDLLLSRLAMTARRSDTVVEVGIGSGTVSRALAGQFDNVVLIEPEIRLVEEVSAYLHGVGISNAVVRHTTVEADGALPSNVDHLVILGLLEHLSDPVVALRRMRTCLSPTGRLYASVNLAGSLHRRLGVAMGKLPDINALTEAERLHGHHRVYSSDAVRRDLTDAGFDVVFERPLFIKPLPTVLLTALPEEMLHGFNLLASELPELASYLYIEAVPA